MRANRTRWAVLGALSLRPMSGYDLKGFFARRVDFFWTESYGQIYPALQQLESDGLVKVSAMAQRGRLTYAITAKGRAALAEWLAEPAEQPVNRLEILLKILFAQEAAPDAALGQVEACRRRQRELLARLDTAAAQLRADASEGDDLPSWRLTVSYGRHVARAILDWCDEAEAVIAGRRPRRRARTR